MTNFIKNTIIAEITADDAKVRFAGTETRRYFGFEATNYSLSAVTSPTRWETRLARIKKMVAHPCAWWFYRFVELTPGDFVPVEVLSMPLREVGPAKTPGIVSVLVGLPRTGMGQESNHGGVAFDKVLEVETIAIGAGLPESID